MRAITFRSRRGRLNVHGRSLQLSGDINSSHFGTSEVRGGSGGVTPLPPGGGIPPLMSSGMPWPPGGGVGVSSAIEIDEEIPTGYESDDPVEAVRKFEEEEKKACGDQ